MSGKNKGGREAKKPKAAKPKLNMSQPSAKGDSASAATTKARAGTR